MRCPAESPDVDVDGIKVQPQVQYLGDITSGCEITLAHDELGLKRLSESCPHQYCKVCAEERNC